MQRREFIKAIGLAAPAIAAECSATASPIPEYLTETLTRPWPTEPHARLVWAKHIWRIKAGVRHEWDIRPDRLSYGGAGWLYEKPNPDAPVFEYRHREISGEGATGIEAVDDWYAKMPTGRIETVFWRAEPELASERDFDTKQTRWQVYSRFAAIEPTTD